MHPAEASHRSATAGVDLALINALMVDLLSNTFSKYEMMTVQMNLLYVLIDLLGVTANMEPEAVLEECRKYFQRIRKENDRIGTEESSEAVQR